MLVHHPLWFAGRTRGIHPERHIGCRGWIFGQLRLHHVPGLRGGGDYDGVALSACNSCSSKQLCVILGYYGCGRFTILKAISD